MSCGTSCPNPLVDTETQKPSPRCDDICPDGKCSITPSSKLNLSWEDPAIKKVTEIDITGDGQFDRYMRAGYEQLKRHYDDGRIKGADLTAAHLQMTELMMTQANAYVLQKYKLDSEIQLMELDFKMKLEKDKLERDILKAQLVKTEMECELAAAQKGKVLADTQLSVTQEIETRKNGAVERGAKKAQSQLIQTQCTELVLNGESKRTLEAAQTLVQKKMEDLYQAQAEGFDDKAKNDLMKTLSNMWSVYASEFNEAESVPYSVYRDNMDNTINDVKDAVGLEHKASTSPQPSP